MCVSERNLKKTMKRREKEMRRREMDRGTVRDGQSESKSLRHTVRYTERDTGRGGDMKQETEGEMEI